MEIPRENFPDIGSEIPLQFIFNIQNLMGVTQGLVKFSLYLSFYADDQFILAIEFIDKIIERSQMARNPIIIPPVVLPEAKVPDNPKQYNLPDHNLLKDAPLIKQDLFRKIKKVFGSTEIDPALKLLIPVREIICDRTIKIGIAKQGLDLIQ